MSQVTAQIVRTFASVVAAGVTLDVAEPASLEQTLRDCAQSAAFIESVRLRAIARLDEHVTVDTNQIIINASRGSKRQAQTVQKRANATAKMPALADALENGSIAADHVDAVARTLSRMDPADREKLAAEQAWIAATAARTTPEQLTKTLQRRALELSSDEGIGLLERQRRNTYLRFWTDPESGMVCIRGEFDPETGARLVGRIRNAAEALFHDRVPDTCPLDERKTTTYVPWRLFISPRGPAVGRVGPTSPLSSIFRRCSTGPTRTPEWKLTEASPSLLRPFVGWPASPTSFPPCWVRTGCYLTLAVRSDWPRHISGERFERCTRPAPSADAVSPSSTARPTTSAIGETAVAPTSAIFCRSAADTITWRTKVGGCSVLTPKVAPSLSSNLTELAKLIRRPSPERGERLHRTGDRLKFVRGNPKIRPRLHRS